ncbi:MAG: CPBP family intramembrane metalloprotease [Phycisphaerales bacterium]|nr:CPBP family intramembrane metalloprotease [Hyphomonadaceae bacterium]
MTMREIEGVAGWTRLLGGFVILLGLLQGPAAALGSLRGEWGLAVAAVTVGGALLVQRALFASHSTKAITSLGLAAPRPRGVWAALAVCCLVLCAYPLFLLPTGAAFSTYPNALWLALGIFLQGGVAEEIVFRGYLYGHIRRRHSFWRAALISTVPFATAHLYMFTTMAWPIALAALVISVLLSFPFAWLYELGGRTIWAPAIAHAVVQGAVKLLVIDAPSFPLIWMAASVAALWLVFLIRPSADSRF